ncbi:hypothetical protein SAMN02745126_00638 [Enhydrobacter aerosaccus]|uniref:Uncharacterized protein n=1 Tax=Enhydrobacter aerosaccus TaxID=225324 RepID=A0A1T4K1D7_9HYPH|nr:hypothetical protein SAMN02745126_00638 [Enhydrobacter aerosaccus]
MPHADEQAEIPQRGRRHPVERHERRGRDRADDGRHRRRGVRSLGLAIAARKDLVEGAATRAGHDPQHMPVEVGVARPHDDEGADEAHAHRCPAPPAHRLAQQPGRQGGDDDRAGERDRGGRGQRQIDHAVEIEVRGEEQQQAAHDLRLQTPDGEQPHAVARQEHRQHEDEGEQVTRPDHLDHRIAGGRQRLGHGIQDREAGHRHDRGEDRPQDAIRRWRRGSHRLQISLRWRQGKRDTAAIPLRSPCS